MKWFVMIGAAALGHMFTRYGEVDEVGRLHYWVHATYAFLEPFILKANDFMSRSRFFSSTRLGRAIFWFVARTNVLLPHGVVIPTGAAIRIIRDIEKYSGDEAHIAVGPCVCQRTLNRYSEPVKKDMTIWYGAEIYKRFFEDEYDIVSPDDAVGMLREFHKKGLTPVAEFLMQSRKWMFVICSCDAEVCCPTRTYNITGRSLYQGPFVAVQNAEGCLGVDECGECIGRCHFNANIVKDGKVLLDTKKCLGCGLCVTTCKGKVRRLEKREGYSGRLLPWEYVKDASINEES